MLGLWLWDNNIEILMMREDDRMTYFPMILGEGVSTATWAF